MDKETLRRVIGLWERSTRDLNNTMASVWIRLVIHSFKLVHDGESYEYIVVKTEEALSGLHKARKRYLEETAADK